MKLTRRHLLAAAAAVPAFGANRPIRLGGPVFLRSDDPRELAREHRRLGLPIIVWKNGKVVEEQP